MAKPAATLVLCRKRPPPRVLQRALERGSENVTSPTRTDGAKPSHVQSFYAQGMLTSMVVFASCDVTSGFWRRVCVSRATAGRDKLSVPAREAHLQVQPPAEARQELTQDRAFLVVAQLLP